jgi:hypothetical protein
LEFDYETAFRRLSVSEIIDKYLSLIPYDRGWRPLFEIKGGIHMDAGSAPHAKHECKRHTVLAPK